MTLPLRQISTAVQDPRIVNPVITRAGGERWRPRRGEESKKVLLVDFLDPIFQHSQRIDWPGSTILKA